MLDNTRNCSQSALKLFTDWNENNIRYCHWKSNEHLLAGLQGTTDLDILISPEDADQANLYLIRNHFKRVISHKWKLYSGVEDWIGMDPDTLVQTHLHVHYRLLTGLKNVKEQYLPWETLVLDHVVRHEDYAIHVCNPNMEIILLAVRVAIKKDSLSSFRSIRWGKSEIREYAYLKDRCDGALVEAFAKKMLSGDCAEACLKVLEDIDNVSNLKAFRKRILRELPMHRKESRCKAECVYYIRQLLYKFSKVIKKPVPLKKNVYTGGKLVSFIGVDGAGKTTLATFSAKWLSWKIHCQYVYLGTGDGRSSFLNRIKKKVFSNSNSSQATSSRSTSDQGKEKPLSIRKQMKIVLKNYVSLSNDKYKYHTIQRIYKLINQGAVVITDRYPQMQFDGIYDGLVISSFHGNRFLVALNEKLRKKERMLYQKMCAVHPDVVVKLEIPVELSLERKPCTGSALEQVKKKVEITPQLHFGDAKEYVIRPVGDWEDTKREVCNLLWRII